MPPEWGLKHWSRKGSLAREGSGLFGQDCPSYCWGFAVRARPAQKWKVRRMRNMRGSMGWMWVSKAAGRPGAWLS